ncbi:MAG: hypothetical protein ACRD5L_16845, partial [Bryobacteraceae bacterium]
SRTAQALLPERDAGDWNQAMMELGATLCTPQAPQCAACPLATFCEARLSGLTGEIPEKRTKQNPVRVTLAAAVFLDARGRTLLVRPERGELRGGGVTAAGANSDPQALFSRMWQFPAISVGKDAAGELAEYLGAEWNFSKRNRPLTLEALAPARHAVTYRSVTLAPFLVRVPRLAARAGAKAVALREIDKLATSSATRKIASRACEILRSSN